MLVTVTTAKAFNYSAIAYAHKNHQLFLGEQTNDLWVRIRKGFALKNFAVQEVRHHEMEYTRNLKYLYRVIERSKPYLYHIVEEVERRRLPTEIVLLPLVESAFDPTAKSRSDALGLWQFIPATGESYGLTQNEWHDDRQDIIAATSAALDYLEKLHAIFGDWRLALAAYNWGKTALRQSIANKQAKGQVVRFHDIELPSETRNHVYKLIAIRNIIAAPEKFGIKLDAIANKPYFAEIKINYPVTIEHIIQLAHITVDEFNKLNPAYKRDVIKVGDSPRILLLPIEKREIFLKNFAVYSKLFHLPQYTHLNKEQQRHEITQTQKTILAHLAAVNVAKKNQNTSWNTIPVPPRKRDIGADINIVRKKPWDVISMGRTRYQGVEKAFTYVVKKGDTLYGIARQYGLSVAQIKSWNNSDERLSIGQELILLPDRSSFLHKEQQLN